MSEPTNEQAEPNLDDILSDIHGGIGHHAQDWDFEPARIAAERLRARLEAAEAELAAEKRSKLEWMSNAAKAHAEIATIRERQAGAEAVWAISDGETLDLTSFCRDRNDAAFFAAKRGGYRPVPVLAVVCEEYAPEAMTRLGKEMVDGLSAFCDRLEVNPAELAAIKARPEPESVEAWAIVRPDGSIMVDTRDTAHEYAAWVSHVTNTDRGIERYKGEGFKATRVRLTVLPESQGGLR